MHRASKTTPAAFLVEDSNLQRILGILHSAAGGSPYGLVILVQQASGKKLTFTTLEGLLRQDNTLRDPVRSLQIKATYADNMSSAELRANAERFPNLTSLHVAVASEDQRWASALAAELQEQVERLRMPGPIYKARQSPVIRNFLPLLLMSLATLLAVLVLADPSPSQRFSVARSELLQSAQAASTQEQKIDFLFTKAVIDLNSEQRATQSFEWRLPVLNSKLLLGVLPLVVALGILFYLVRHCYPPAVFSWGDAAKSYAQLLERRRALWSVLITVLLLGLLVNLSSPVISAWLGA